MRLKPEGRHQRRCWSWAGGGGWSCMLLLHPVLTFADPGPDLCTLRPDLCTLCLRWLSPAATSGGGVSPSDIGTKTPLAPTVVSPIATCAGGVFPSTHRRRYQPYTQATCTVWWWFFGGGCRCMCMWWWCLYLRGGGFGVNWFIVEENIN